MQGGYLANLVRVLGRAVVVFWALYAEIGDVEVSPGTHGAQPSLIIKVPSIWTRVIWHADRIPDQRAELLVGPAGPALLAS
jgi:hypothetical protein